MKRIGSPTKSLAFKAGLFLCPYCFVSFNKSQALHPVEIKISNASEVRIGSPYHTCDIELVGADNLQLPKTGWQDIYSWSVDLKKLALIRWDFTNDEPGYRLYVIDFETNAIDEFSRAPGFPRIISFPNDDRVVIKKCYDNSDKSESEDYIDEYSFSTVFIGPTSGIRGWDEDARLL